MSLRNVVTSCGRLSLSSTATVPCSIPTGTVRLNSLRTTSGGAAVVRSKSWFSRPSRLSRIAPPTHQVSKPASSSFRAILSTASGMGRRSGKFILCGFRIADVGLRIGGAAAESAIHNPQSAIESSTQHAPPVHVQHLPRHVSRERRAQEHDRPRYVFGAGDPSERDRALDLPPPPSPVPPIGLCRHLRIDRKA